MTKDKDADPGGKSKHPNFEEAEKSFHAFQDFASGILAVPKAEVEAEEKQWKQEQKTTKAIH